MLFIIEVAVRLKDGIPNPEAHKKQMECIEAGLPIETFQIGKYFRLVVEAESESAARQKVDAMCIKLLAKQDSETHKIVSVEQMRS